MGSASNRRRRNGLWALLGLLTVCACGGLDEVDGSSPGAAPADADKSDCPSGCPDASVDQPAEDPEPPAPPEDPFDPASCAGPAMTMAQAVARFEPGGTRVSVGDYVLLRRSRSCNAVTGCGPWSEPTSLLGHSLGSLTPNLEMRGQVSLEVEGDSISLRLRDGSYDTAGSMCSPVGGEQRCDGYYFVMGSQWAGSGGLFPTWGEIEPIGDDLLVLDGVLTDTCLRLGALSATADAEEEYAILVRLGEPESPEEPVCPVGQQELQCGGLAPGLTTCCTAGLVTCPQAGCDCYASCG